METVAEALALTGAVFALLAGIGVLRFRDVYARMHAATKAATLGVALVGLGAAIAVDGGGSKALLGVVFIFITAPSAAHLVGRAAYRAEGIELDLAARDDLATMLDELDAST